MNPDWKNHPIVADLAHFGLIAFNGEDSLTFLQGQATNDVRQVTCAGQAQFGSLCTPKGRMLATFLLWHRDGDYFMELPAALRENIQQHLSKYVLRAKVKIRDASAELVRLGVAGKGAAEILNGIFGTLPQTPYGVVQNERGILIALPGERYEIVAAADRASAWRDELRPTCKPVDAAYWDWLAIQAGMPAILPATQEQFTPQMANVELLGGVSFTKGCYTGQEVVARTQHLGKVKRRLYLAHIDGDGAPWPGDELSGAELGMIVNAQPAPNGGCDVLAVIPTEDAKAGNVRWKNADGPLLQFHSLPYAVS
jgi:folate-binding protein YgfZ